MNYTTVGTEGRSWWETGTHLQRTIILATASRLPDAEPVRVMLAAKAALALRCWCENDFQNSNWWWSWIGTPRAVASVLWRMLGLGPRHLLQHPAWQWLDSHVGPVT